MLGCDKLKTSLKYKDNKLNRVLTLKNIKMNTISLINTSSKKVVIIVVKTIVERFQ